MKKNFESALELDTAVALCCLEIRRLFKDMPHTALDKKANFECLERDVGLAKFFPNVRVHTLARIIYNEYGWDFLQKATNKN